MWQDLLTDEDDVCNFTDKEHAVLFKIKTTTLYLPHAISFGLILNVWRLNQYAQQRYSATRHLHKMSPEKWPNDKDVISTSNLIRWHYKNNATYRCYKRYSTTVSYDLALCLADSYSNTCKYVRLQRLYCTSIKWGWRCVEHTVVYEILKAGWKFCTDWQRALIKKLRVIGWS